MKDINDINDRLNLEDSLFSHHLIANVNLLESPLSYGISSLSGHGPFRKTQDNTLYFDLKNKDLLGNSHPLLIKSILESARYSVFKTNDYFLMEEFQDLKKIILEDMFKNFFQHIYLFSSTPSNDQLPGPKLNLGWEEINNLETLLDSTFKTIVDAQYLGRFSTIPTLSIEKIKQLNPQIYILNDLLPLTIILSKKALNPGPDNEVRCFDVIYSSKVLKYLMGTHFLGDHGKIFKDSMTVTKMAQALLTQNIKANALATTLTIEMSDKVKADLFHKALQSEGIDSEKINLNLKFYFPLCFTQEHFDFVLNALLKIGSQNLL